MPPLPNSDSMWYWPSSTVSTIDEGSSTRTSPSTGQKLIPSSYLILQRVQCFIGFLVYNERLTRGELVSEKGKIDGLETAGGVRRAQRMDCGFASDVGKLSIGSIA